MNPEVLSVSGEVWYVLQSKLHKESQVDRLLQARRFDSFLPTITVKPVNPRASKVQAYFPGYLFVRADLAVVGSSAFEWIPGAIRLVQFDDQPAPVSDDLIERLRKHVSAQHLKPIHPLDGLKPGDKVYVKHGSLAGYEGLFDTQLSGGERARILIQMLGRMIKAEVNAGALSKRSI